jgi:putative transcriptional regulator
MKSDPLEFNPELMISEFGQFVKDYKKGDLSKYRVSEITAPVPAPKTHIEILALREKKLRMSRGVFAQVLNVPQATLRAWETGKRKPSGAAIRLLDVVERMPQIVHRLIVPVGKTFATPAVRKFKKAPVFAKKTFSAAADKKETRTYRGKKKSK